VRERVCDREREREREREGKVYQLLVYYYLQEVLPPLCIEGTKPGSVVHLLLTKKKLLLTKKIVVEQIKKIESRLQRLVMPC
jgi:hypothetical protein